MDDLARLITKYRLPLEIYLHSAFPALREHTNELLQDFAADRLTKPGWLAHADPARGRFRDFLKASLKNFVLDWIRANQRRGKFESLENLSEVGDLRLEAQLALQSQFADDAYDLECLRAMIAEALRRMEADCTQGEDQQSRRKKTWQIFNLRVLQPILQGAKAPPYEELVQRLGLRSPSEGTNLLLTAKRIFERQLFLVLGEYESAAFQRAGKAEIDELKQVLQRLARHP